MKFPGQSTFRDDEAASMKASRQGNALTPPGGCNDGACGGELRGPRSLNTSACVARMESSCGARPIGIDRGNGGGDGAVGVDGGGGGEAGGMGGGDGGDGGGGQAGVVPTAVTGPCEHTVFFATQSSCS